MKDKKGLLYERALITCVVMLFICLIFKVFGCNWFNFETNIPLLNAIDDVIMGSVVLSFMYSFIFTFINFLMVVLIATKCNLNKGVICEITCYVVTILCYKYFVGYGIKSMAFETTVLYLACKYNSKDKIFLEFILVSILNILFQVLSLYLRGFVISVEVTPVLVGVLLNLDYYILLVITYLYLKKGDTTLCGVFHHFGSFLAKTLWKRHSQD